MKDKENKKNTEDKETLNYRDEGKNPMHFAQRTLFQALIIVLVVWIAFGFVFGIMLAPNKDMYPNINAGDMLLYYRLERDILSQDVIVFKKNKTTYIGRVIAREGDTVEITNKNQLIINNSIVTESNVFFSTSKYEGFQEYPVTLKKDEFFVLADMREHGEDSRYFGPVKKSEVKGKVITLLRRINL